MKLSELGKEIRRLRKEQGLTQEQLAQKVRISRPTLSKIEQGEFGNVSVAKLAAILVALGYEICLERFNPFKKFS